jgi:DNA-binding CsgD family transcriptional regulator
MVGRSFEAVESLDAAIALHAASGDIEAEAWALVMSDRPLVLAGRQAEADARVARAAELLAGRPPSRSAAMLATCQSANHMLARRFTESEQLGQQAIELAQLVDAPDILAEVSIQSGIALAMSGDDRGLDRIREGIELALAIGSDYLVALGYSQIGSGYGEMRTYDVAVPALSEGVTFGEAREFGSTYYMRAWLARCELELGHWDEAGTIAADLVRNPRSLGISRFVALVTLAWLRGRRGDPDVRPLVDEALELAHSTGHIQRLWPIAACRAELAWIADRLDDELELVERALSAAAQLEYVPAIEELSHWLHIGDGRARGSEAGARTAFGLSAAGRPDLAADRWDTIGCPYEAATARFLSGANADLRSALQTFERLGATPMRSRTAAALRSAGQRVARGPTSNTRHNPASLTDRELDVLLLVTAGRTNREIAGDLGISVKTAGHHVSSVLAKLAVRSRGEAAVAAMRLGIVTEN